MDLTHFCFITDEGEHESRDVEPRAPLAPQPMQQQPRVVSQQQQQQQPRRVSQQQQQQPRMVTQRPTQQTPRPPSHSPAPPLSVYPSRPSQPSRPTQSSSPFVTAASLVLQGGTTTGGTAILNQQQAQSSQQSLVTSHVNPYSRTRAMPPPLVRGAATQTAAQSGSTTSTSAALSPRPLPAPATITTSQSTPPPTKITFAKLHEQLVRAQQDPSLYQQMYQTDYAVQLVQVGLKDYFNIEKRKDRRKSDAHSKYEYVLRAKFADHTAAHAAALGAKVASSILEPHFSLSPADMRSLSKQDKARANELVRDGGRHVHAQLSSSNVYQVSLYLTPTEFFGQPEQPALEQRQYILLLSKILE